MNPESEAPKIPLDSKEWCMEMAKVEGDSEIGAGCPCVLIPNALCPIHGVGPYMEATDPNRPSPASNVALPEKEASKEGEK